jgi:simple sugar transport system permease protein
MTRVQPLLRSLLVPTLAIVTALIVGGIVILVSDPGTTLRDVGDSYHALFDSSLGSSRAISRTLGEATPLMFAGLSVALAFRAGLFNIGGGGQLMVGATLSGYVGFTYDLPTAIHLPLAIVAGIAGGALWGAIAGLLKARTGAHEVITTIMLNFVALRLVDHLLTLDAFRREGRNDPISPPVHESARLTDVTVNGYVVGLGLLLALLAAVGMWWLLGRSTVGFRLRAVGTEPEAARYAGMSVGRTYVLAMVLAGGLAGLAGTANILGRPSFSLTGGYYQFIGFDAIALALVGRANAAGVVAASLLFAVLRSGSTGMQAQTSTPVDIIVVIQALIIMFVAAPALIRAIYRVRGRGVGEEQSFTTGWGG